VHDLIDTDDADAAAERFWPEGFKQIIREEVGKLVNKKFKQRKSFHQIYEERFSHRYADFDRFVERMADMVVIGAENGADDAFDDIHAAFQMETPLLDSTEYAHHLWPQGLDNEIRRRIHKSVIEEYGKERYYQRQFKNANEDWPDKYSDISRFLDEIARLVVTGAANGADDMLEETYKALLLSRPLPPARRHPKRLKIW
jgi:uncharacterized protein YciU (UPF0263 family)